jgi:hypothetical protein
MFPSAWSRKPLALAAVWLMAVLLLASCNLGADQAQTVISGVPTVQLSAPLPNATFMEGVPVNIQALISNAGPDIGRVEIVVDGTVIASLASPNTSGAATFSIPTQSWPATGSGSHTITVTAFRNDGSSSTPATVTVTVVNQLAQTEEPTPPTEATEATDGGSDNNTQAEPTDAPEPTDEPEPAEESEPEATDTPSRPTLTITTGVNLRRGPGTVFNPPVGSMPPNATADIVAVNPSGDWYKVRSTYGEGWISAAFVTVSGDVDSLPVDPGPPTPVPFTPTPVATATPVTNANLIIVGTPVISPHPLECGEAASVRVVVQNNGTGPTAAEGRILVEDIHTGSNARQQSTEGTFPVLQPGQTFTAEMRITVSTFFNEGHRIVITIDNNNTIPETNEGDNRFTSDYVLEKSGCN